MVKWTTEQLAAIETTNNNILVAAAAGSGKTAVLVERIIQKLLNKENPINIDEILVATFTNAAAEEMRNRIGVALNQAISEDPTSYHLKKQHSLLQRASISTLHSFCTSIVRQYAYLINIDPAFRIADEMEIDLLKHEVIDELFEEKYAAKDVQDFFTVVDMFSNDRNDADVEQLILKLYEFAMQNPWPNEWLREVSEIYNLPESPDVMNLPWLSILQNELGEQLDSHEQTIRKAIEIAREPDGPYHYLEALEADLSTIDNAKQLLDNWHELQMFVANSKLKSLSRKKVECNEDLKETIKKLRETFRKDWNEMKKRWFSRSLSGHLADMQKLYPAIREITLLVEQFAEKFTAVKRERAIADFTDLEHFCLQILRHSDSTMQQVIPSSIALQYQKKFKEILVDEYQDINQVQETILQLVSNQSIPGNMFMVGDVKQSIYGFRHAEPTLFIEKYNQYQKSPESGIRIDLAKNFRSREEILTGANFIFRQIFDETLGDINYDADAELIYGNKSYDEQAITDPEVELYVIDREGSVSSTDEEDTEDLAGIQLEARMYAEKINEWLGKKDKPTLQVIDKQSGKKRPVTYRDIVILQRSLTGSATIVDELKKQGIPVYAELRTGYFIAIEIQVMLNLLKIIDNPYQDISLASVLRSPIVGLNEEQLAKIRLVKRTDSFYEAVVEYAKGTEHESKLLAKFLQQLAEFQTLAREGELADLIWEIYQVTGYYDFVGGIPGGRQRQANLRALYDRARSYEATSFRGLFRFLRFIERMQEQGKDLGEARALSEQEDVVRIMTIHKSKGLEFPLVILGNMNKEFNFRDIRSKYILDKDEGFATKFIDPIKRITYPTLYYLAVQQEAVRKLLSEEMRVLYVALTRAKEKLVMIGNVKDFSKQVESWQAVANDEEWILQNQIRKNAKTYLDWVGPALVRHHMNENLHVGIDALNFNQSIFNDQAKFKVAIIERSELQNVTPSERMSKTELQQLIDNWSTIQHRDKNLDEKVAEILSFAYPYQEAANSRAKQSVTEIKRRQEIVDTYSAQTFTKSFQTSQLKRPKFLQATKQLSASEIGTAMHTVMQHIDLEKCLSLEEIDVAIERFVEDEKITAMEASKINREAILRFYDSEIAHIIRDSHKIEREVPFTYTLAAETVYPATANLQGEKVLIQGVIDCIIYHENNIYILDYKTDLIKEREISQAVMEKYRNKYLVQIQLYKEALSNILGHEISASYLYFFDKDLIVKV